MTIKSRTIDNLGIDASIRYANDQKLLEPRLIEESKLVAQKTQVSVDTPYILGEQEALLSKGKPLAWAYFSAPSYEPPLAFSFQLIPSLKGYETIEEDIDPEKLMEDALARKRQGREDSQEDKKEDEKEKEILLELLRCIAKIDQSIEFINARRNQYQRG